MSSAVTGYTSHLHSKILQLLFHFVLAALAQFLSFVRSTGLIHLTLLYTLGLQVTIRLPLT
jgi:hypothetical protein